MSYRKNLPNHLFILREFYGSILLFAWSLLGCLLVFAYPDLMSKSIVEPVYAILGVVVMFIWPRGNKTRHWWLSPLQLFSIMWIGIAGITGVPLPIVGPLSAKGWIVIFFTSMAFSFGYLISLLISSYKTKSIHTYTCVKDWQLPRGTAIVFLLIGIGGYIAQLLLAGGMSELIRNPALWHRHYGKQVLSFIGAVGSIGVYLAVSMKRWRSIFMEALISMYMICLFLSAASWGLITLFLVLSSRLALRPVDRKIVFKLVVIGLSIIAIFYGIHNLRTSIIAVERYFILTGIYRGSPSALRKMQFFLYMGSPFRVMDKYLTMYSPGITHGYYTFYPLLSFTQLNNILGASGVPQIKIYGYNAAAFPAYAYLDFGWWGIFLIPMLLGFLSFKVYITSVRWEGRGFIGYWWGVIFLSISLMFFSYIDSYAFWLVHYPVLLLLLTLIYHFLPKVYRRKKEKPRPAPQI
jgi:hypothetical protein